MDFTYCKLNNILTSIHSGGTPSTAEKEYWGGPYKWLSSGETSQRFITDTIYTITDRGIRESSTKLAKRGSVVMACAGQGKTRGQTSFLMDDMYVNQSVIVLNTDTEKVLPLYLFYDLSSRYDELRGGSDASSTRGSITTTSLKALSFRYPSIKKQKQIVSILSKYDELIEVNNKRIKILEQTAEELYKEWFVRFRFPGHETAQFENGLPNGWKNKRLKDVFNIVLGGTPSRDNDSFWNGNIPWINSGAVNNSRIIRASEYITDKGYSNSATTMMPIHTTVLAITGATLGQVSFTEIEVCGNQSVVGIFGNTPIYEYYLFGAINSCISELVNYASGGAQQSINKEMIKKYKLMIPSNMILEQYNKVIAPIFSETAALLLKNENLIKQRDLLLPRLMSGKLEV